MKRKNQKKVDLFLDSGAFSAWSQKTSINLKDYIQFIKDHKHLIDVYANLDDIHDPEITYKNQIRMEKAGLSPIPVFHYAEDIKWLKKYIDKGHDYIALGGMVPISTSRLVPWLDDLFSNYLTDKNGMPICKVHGFGLTALRLMIRYPWYSVDSTAWVMVGRMGGIYVPRRKNGRWIYGEDWKVQVSSQSPKTKVKGQHIDTMRPAEKELLNLYLEEKGYKLGKSKFKMVAVNYKPKDNERWAEKKDKAVNGKRNLEIILEDGVANRYQQRDEMNIIYFIDLEKYLPKWPWAFKKVETQKGFL